VHLVKGAVSVSNGEEKKKGLFFPKRKKHKERVTDLPYIGNKKEGKGFPPRWARRQRGEGVCWLRPQTERGREKQEIRLPRQEQVHLQRTL